MDQIESPIWTSPREEALYRIELYYEAVLEVIPGSGMEELLSTEIFNHLESWALKQYMLLCRKYVDEYPNMQQLMSNADVLQDFDAFLKVFLIRKHTGIADKFDKELDMIFTKPDDLIRIPPKSPLRPRSLTRLNTGCLNEKSRSSLYSTFSWEIPEYPYVNSTPPITPSRKQSSRSGFKKQHGLKVMRFPPIREESILARPKRRRIYIRNNETSETSDYSDPFNSELPEYISDSDDQSSKRRRIRHVSSYNSLKEIFGRTKNYFRLFSRRSKDENQ